MVILELNDKMMSLAISKVWVNNRNMLVLGLNNQNDIQVPLSLYPRLQNATEQQRNNYELWNNGKWLHWEDLDEDLSLDGFLKYQNTEKAE